MDDDKNLVPDANDYLVMRERMLAEQEEGALTKSSAPNLEEQKLRLANLQTWLSALQAKDGIKYPRRPGHS